MRPRRSHIEGEFELPDSSTIVVFVHGWSVTSTNTYGGLPDRLRGEARSVGLSLAVRNIFMARYISSHVEVLLEDN